MGVVAVVLVESDVTVVVVQRLLGAFVLEKVPGTVPLLELQVWLLLGLVVIREVRVDHFLLVQDVNVVFGVDMVGQLVIILWLVLNVFQVNDRRFCEVQATVAVALFLVRGVAYIEFALAGVDVLFGFFRLWFLQPQVHCVVVVQVVLEH